MNIHIKKAKWHLAPADQDSLVYIKKMKNDKVYKVKITEARNYEFLQKFMVLIKLGHENSKNLGHVSIDTYRSIVTCSAGFGKFIETPWGKLPEAESISFGSMNQDKFENVYRKVFDVICIDIGSTSEEVEQEMINLMLN